MKNLNDYMIDIGITEKTAKTMRNFGVIHIAVLLCLIAFTADASEIVGRGVWSAGNGHEYVVVNFRGETWNNAVADLHTLLPGYHLATITSQEENEFVSNLMISLNAYGQYWLGGFQDPIDEPVPDKGWTWVTSEPWDYTNWDCIEPNDGGRLAGEQHLAMYGYGPWNDEGSAIASISGYVAEEQPPDIQVSVDIKPGSCPNSLNKDAAGILTVAILGTEDFGVTAIDTASVRLEGIAPIRSSVKDVAGPVIDREDVCDCTKDMRDGFDDLVLNFSKGEVLEVFGEASDGEILELVVTGSLSDGTPIQGIDCIVIVNHGESGEVTIDFNYLQYRTFDPSSNGVNGYKGYIELTKDGMPVVQADIKKIELRDENGANVPIAASFYPSTYFYGMWKPSNSGVDFSGPLSVAGFDINFLGDDFILYPGDYTWVVTTSDNEVVSKPINYPGIKMLPYVDSGTMVPVRQPDGSLELSWTNPSGDYDQLRVVIRDQTAGAVLYARLPPNVNEMTIPKKWMKIIEDYYVLTNTIWHVQTRAYTVEDMNYARGYANWESITGSGP